MTVANRIRTIKMIERMERMNQNGSANVIKENGTYKYVNDNGDVMFEARINRKD